MEIQQSMALATEDTHVFSQQEGVPEQGSDDWVALMLRDVEFDDTPVPLNSLADFPLPDLDDMVEFINFEQADSNSSCSNSICIQEGQACSPSNFVGPAQMFHDSFSPSQGESSSSMDADQHCIEEQRNHGFHQATNRCQSPCNGTEHPRNGCRIEHPSSGYGKEHASPLTATCDGSGSLPVNDEFNGSPSQGSFVQADTFTDLLAGDSGSEDDNLYFLVSELCGNSNTESLSNTRANHAGVPPSNGSLMQKDICLNSPQNLPCGSQSGDKSETVRKIIRKRKALDRTSRSTSPEGSSLDCDDGAGNAQTCCETKDEDEERRQARLMRNRESAQLSRQRKKLYIDELEDKIKTMASTIAELNNTINLISAENINLRRQLGGVYPPAPGHIGSMPGIVPWVGPYTSAPVMGGRFVAPGSQVPLVPIPRWKSQNSTPLKKTKKAVSEAQEKGTAVKVSKRTKKVAGVATAGIFFFLFILLPANLNLLSFNPNVLREDTKVWSSSSWSMNSLNLGIRTGGRVLTSINEGSDENTLEKWYSIDNRAKKSYDKDLQSRKSAETTSGYRRKETEKPVQPGSSLDRNASVPLAATLFVPRNDRLQRIEGNLIIHSVLAGERAALESLNRTNSESVKMQVADQKGEPLDANLNAIAVKAAAEEKGALVELQRVLAKRSSHKEGSIQSVHEDGSFQQWFLEDLAGPVFSSGMCTEVFQFETSVPTSSDKSRSTSHTDGINNLIRNDTRRPKEHGQRRMGRSGLPSRKHVPYAVPLPPVGYKKNNTQMGSDNSFQSERESRGKNQTRSSVVVSLLAGLDMGDQTKLTGGGKSLSRIFVVVLIDSVQYVTYSCMLPSSGPKSHYEVVTV